MRRLVLTIASLLFLPEAGFAERAEFTVRLYWLQAVREMKLAPGGAGLRIRPCGDCKLKAMNRLATVRLTGGRLTLDGETIPGREIEASGSYLLEVTGHLPVESSFPLRIRAAKDQLHLLLRISLEDYVPAVLAGESANFDSDPSLQAMAVAVRSYAAQYRGRHRSEGFDFCDTTHCQDLRLSGVTPRLRAAAEETVGELLWHQGRPAATYYHRDCGGTTEAAERAWGGTRIPYLRQQSDDSCGARGRMQWQSRISRQELRRALENSGAVPPGVVEGIEVVSRTPSGRVARLRLTGSEAVPVSADTLRLAVGRTLGWDRIRSDLYEVDSLSDVFVFRGYGAGHGVGLCQTGAAEMGRSGRGYREILAFYYPGTTLGLTAQGLAWQHLQSERVELFTTRPHADRFLLGIAERLVREVEGQLGWPFDTPPALKVFPSVEVFRNATGEPGWVAATSRGRRILLQPAEILRASRLLESTLRHELLHVLVESRARRDLPLWFREGLVLSLAADGPPGRNPKGLTASDVERRLLYSETPGERRAAYADARALVDSLLTEHGRERVLRWLERGLPEELGAWFGDGR